MSAKKCVITKNVQIYWNTWPRYIYHVLSSSKDRSGHAFQCKKRKWLIPTVPDEEDYCVVDVVINSVMGLKGWEGVKGVRIKGVMQMLLGKGSEWMGIQHHEQNTGPPSKLGFFLSISSFWQRVFWLMIDCVLCKYEWDFVCRLKVNHAWSASSHHHAFNFLEHSHGSETLTSLSCLKVLE